MVRKRRPALIAALAAAAISASVTAEEIGLESSFQVDWNKGVVMIDIEADITGSSSPGVARVAAEERLRREIASVFCNAIFDLNLDSSRTVKEAAENNSKFLASLLDIGNRTPPFHTYLNTTLDTLTAKYEFNFYPDIINVFVRHTQPYDPVEILEYVPVVEYTGIVIYAKGEYPIQGEDPARKNPERFNPSLLPKLYDTEMVTVAEARMMDPVYLARWGVFGYADTTDYLLYKERIGAAPLLTIARAVFGDNRTDLLIPKDAARKILATQANRNLIRQGRILVICDFPKQR